MPSTPRLLPLILCLCLAGCQIEVAPRPYPAGQRAPGPPATSLDALQAAIDEAHARFRTLAEGKNADYIPYLAKVDPKLFGIVVVTTDGKVLTAGDTDHVFAIESVSKPFTLALAMQAKGPEAIEELVGVEPTGLPFNSILAIEQLKARSVNPLVNAGAIATVSLLEAGGAEERWRQILDGLSRFAGQPLSLLEEVYRSEASTNYRNRAIANLLFAYGRLYCDPAQAVAVYTKQCSIGVTARQLAMMGATLANGGKHPTTGQQVVDPAHVPKILAMMMTAGFYDESGSWAYNAGVPAKTGVGGGIVAVVPGKMAIVAFSPPLDTAGNSVRAQRAIRYVVGKLGLGLYANRARRD